MPPLRREWIFGYGPAWVYWILCKEQTRQSVSQRVYFNASLVLARRAINRIHTEGGRSIVLYRPAMHISYRQLGCSASFLDSFQSLIGVPEVTLLLYSSSS